MRLTTDSIRQREPEIERVLRGVQHFADGHGHDISVWIQTKSGLRATCNKCGRNVVVSVTRRRVHARERLPDSCQMV